MFTKFALVSLLCVCGSVYSSQLDLQPILQLHQRTMQMLTRTFESAASPRAAVNAQVPINECFDYYNNQQAAISDKYNKEYNLCVDTAKAAKVKLSQQSAAERAGLVQRGHAVCSSLSACEENEDGLQFFQCYYKATSESVTEVYNISAASETTYNTLSVEYQKVDDDEKVCTTTAKNEYVTNLSAAATNLNNCLLGEWVPPSDTTTTEQTPSTEPITTTPEKETTESSTTTTTVIDTTTEAEVAPEEDVMSYKPMSRMNMWNIMRRL